MTNLGLLLFLLIHPIASHAKTWALFSPNNGKKAFDTIYHEIDQAKEEISVTLYSWAIPELKVHLIEAIQRGVKVRVLLHPPLAKNSRIKEWTSEIEDQGGLVKVAAMLMHEKFFIIDNHFLVNSSANFSRGPLVDYRENFIFHSRDGEKEIEQAFQYFNREFAILWNSGKGPREPMNISDIHFLSDEIFFSSSSQNFSYQTLTNDESGRSIQLHPIKNNGEQTWQVRNAIISEIQNSKKSIFCALNHLVIKDVADALLAAARRGVDVRLVVDGQEFKSPQSKSAYTPYFVEQWKKEFSRPPMVRFYFYGFFPSPIYWKLNHHKFLIIDENQLISGSYNISQTAEQRQFDNMVFYKGEKFRQIISDFTREFFDLWMTNRTEEGIIPEFTDYLSVPQKNYLPIHSNKPFAASWDELQGLKEKISKVAPFLIYNGHRKKHCHGVDVSTRQFLCGR